MGQVLRNDLSGPIGLLMRRAGLRIGSECVTPESYAKDPLCLITHSDGRPTRRTRFRNLGSDRKLSKGGSGGSLNLAVLSA